MTASGAYQVVIPMAGLGSRFTQAGYSTPKPLLPIHGVQMFRVVLANVITQHADRVVVISQKEWELQVQMDDISARLGLPVKLIEVSGVTSGPAATIELAEACLDPGMPVVTANSDQYVDAKLDDFITTIVECNFDGAILTMIDDDPKWSYVRVNPAGLVAEVREKQVISSQATVGIYGFKSAGQMYQAFRDMKAAGETVNNELYVAPAYNQMISRGAKIIEWNLGGVAEVMFGMGIPEDYEHFLTTSASIRAADLSRSLGIA